MPIPAYAKVQTMTTTEKKRRIEEIGRQYHYLLTEQITLKLEVEMEEGRPDGYNAKWCRAWLAGDTVECERLMNEQYPEAK